MNKLKKLQFEHISGMHLLDLKAQKKNINFKKFFSLPLTFEETIANNIQSQKSAIEEIGLIQTQPNFKIKKHRVPRSKLDKLSLPKKHN